MRIAAFFHRSYGWSHSLHSEMHEDSVRILGHKAEHSLSYGLKADRNQYTLLSLDRTKKGRGFLRLRKDFESDVHCRKE